MSDSLYSLCSTESKKRLLKQREETLKQMDKHYKEEREIIIRDIHELRLLIKQGGEESDKDRSN